MSNVNPSLVSRKDFEDTPQGMQQLWLRELAAAKKAAEKWEKAGERITKVFLDERDGDVFGLVQSRLNVFSANIITPPPRPKLAVMAEVKKLALIKSNA